MKWRCEVCGYIHDGEGPPATCPKCGVGYEEFYKLEEQPDACPECGSKLRPYQYDNTECFECEACGYDSCEEYEKEPEERASQREKAKYNPYKVGGGHRTR